MLLAMNFVSTLRAWNFVEVNPQYGNLKGIILSQMSDFAHEIEEYGGNWDLVDLAYDSHPEPTYLG